MPRQIALELNLIPARFLRGDLARKIAEAVVRKLNQAKKQHPIHDLREAQLLPHPALEQLKLLLNFDMDSSRPITLLLIGHPVVCAGLSPRNSTKRRASVLACIITWKE